MPSLHNVDDRFGTLLTIVEGGSGEFTGIVSEPGQGEVPSYQFNLPRRLLRVNAGLPLAAGMVVTSPEGTTWMLGDHGSSEVSIGAIFRNYRMFEATQKFTWQKRGKVVDPVTRLPKDSGLVPQPDIWGAYEPSPEMFDRQMRTSFEAGRFITTADVQRDDVVDGKKVSRVDIQLGLRLCVLG
jgi:hypothetical protein